MLFHVDVKERTVAEIPATSLAALQLWERKDLQEWVIHTPELLGEDLLVITSEFAGFDRTSERLDVLALDRTGKLVVVELKRSAAGTAAELQALRYAAFCSTMSLGDVTELHRDFLRKRGRPDCSSEEAAELIAGFVEQPDFSTLDDKPRVILAAESFPPEITATVIWLRSFDLDIRCLRLRPYRIGERLVLESSVLIPLPEAEAFLVRRERKEAVQTGGGGRSPVAPEVFLATVPESLRPVMEHLRAWFSGQDSVRETAFKSLLAYRRASDGAWVSWLQFTKGEVRVSIPPGVPLDPARVVRRSSDGWPIVGARTVEEAVEVEGFLAEAIARMDDPEAGSGDL